jgi:hypothetical protein
MSRLWCQLLCVWFGRGHLGGRGESHALLFHQVCEGYGARVLAA